MVTARPSFWRAPDKLAIRTRDQWEAGSIAWPHESRVRLILPSGVELRAVRTPQSFQERLPWR